MLASHHTNTGSHICDKRFTVHSSAGFFCSSVFTVRHQRLHAMQRTVAAKAFLSVCPSVCLSNECIVTKNKETCAHMKERLS